MAIVKYSNSEMLQPVDSLLEPYIAYANRPYILHNTVATWYFLYDRKYLKIIKDVEAFALTMRQQCGLMGEGESSKY